MTFDTSTTKIDVKCSAGFYIRSLVHDLGEYLGSCAYMSSLVRQSVGDLSIDKPGCIDFNDAAGDSIVNALELTNSTYNVSVDERIKGAVDVARRHNLQRVNEKPKIRRASSIK